MKSKESLFAWLNAEIPGWEHTIGKVLDEDVLFQDGLSPQKESDGKSSLYGVQIDLSEIEKEPKTLADYEFELSELELQVRNLNDKMEQEKQLCVEDEIRIRNRFHEKIKPAKREVEEKKYTIDQADLERESLNDRKIILIQKAETEKAKETTLVNEKLDALKEAEDQAKLHVTNLKTELDKELSKIRKAFDRKLAELRAEFSLFQKQKNQEKEELLEQRDTRILDLKNEQDGQLKAQGADTDRIKRIDDQIAKIDSELSIIETEMKTAIEFEQDKRELFDKENGWRQEKSKLQNQLEQAETQFQNQAQKLKSELSDLDEGIRKLGEDLRSSKNQLDAYQKFQQTEVFQGLELLEKGHFLTEKGCEELIQTINTRFNKRISETDLLKEALNIFLGHFTENNIFKFRTKLITTAEYLQFATELKEFFDDARIEEYEKRVTDRFVEIIRTICKQTDNLMSKGGEIQKVISKINSDFVERNFAGVIGKIELRIMDSSDRVVTHLLRIKKFSDENSFDDYSTLPLFATSKSELQNSKAVELLLQLDKEIRDVKKVSLSDSFDLQFRVEENQTDTGWVESLANVGSEGTDVLVKAMINIMLLNVFKENASKKFKDFRLHCMMDEIGKLHPSNVRGILRFANDRNIVLLNGSPTENSNALDYKHIYKLTKDSKAKTKVVKLLSNYSTV